MQPSPYTPGEVAHAVPGRADLIGEFAERLSYLVDVQRLVGRIQVLFGDRGIGKTSLLRAYQRLAEERGALCVWVTAGEKEGLITQIVAGLGRATESWPAAATKSLRARMDDVTLTLGLPGVATVQAKASAREQKGLVGSREVEHLVREALRDRKRAKALIFFIDEVQEADADGLRTLAYAWQQLQAEGTDVPAGIYAAGLPHAADHLAKAVRFSERFAFRSLELLTTDAQIAALRDPALAQGVVWDEDALATVAERAGGYPYAVQVYGDAAWKAAGYPDVGGRIAHAHVLDAALTAAAELRRFHARHFTGRTVPQRRFLTLLAWAQQTAPEGSTLSELVDLLGDSARSVSTVRRNLRDLGLVSVTDSDRTRIALHGFAEYIRELEADPREPGERRQR